MQATQYDTMSSSTSASLPYSEQAQEGTTTPAVPCSSPTASLSQETTAMAILPTMDSPPNTTTTTRQPHGNDSPSNPTVTGPRRVTEDDPDVWVVAKSGYQFRLPRSMAEHAVANGFGINPLAEAEMELENEFFAKTLFNNDTGETEKAKKERQKQKKELTPNEKKEAKEKRRKEKQLEAAKSLHFKRSHPIAYPEYADPGRGPFIPYCSDKILGCVYILNNFLSRLWVHVPAADLGKTEITCRILETFLWNLPEDGQKALRRNLVHIVGPTEEEEAMEARLERFIYTPWPSSKSGRTKRDGKINALKERLKGSDMEKLEKVTALKDKLVGMMSFIDPTSLIRPDQARKTACLDRDYDSCAITRTRHDDTAEPYDPPNDVEGECHWQSTDPLESVYTEAVYIFNPKIIASFDWDTLKRYFPSVYKQIDEHRLCQESNIITMRGDLVDDFVNLRFALKPITNDLANRWHALAMDEMPCYHTYSLETFDCLAPERRNYLEGICPDTIELLPRVDPEKWKVVAPATRPELLNLHRTMAKINNILERKIPHWRTGGVDEWEDVDEDEKPKKEEVEVEPEVEEEEEEEEEGEMEEGYMLGSFEEFIAQQDYEWREDLMAAWIFGGR